MRWARISIQLPSAAVEPAAALLLEIGCSGTEQPSDLNVVGYLPVDDRLEPALGRLNEALAAFPALGLAQVRPQVAVTFVEDDNWEEAWKKHFGPVRVGRRLLVIPPWETPAPGEKRLIVRVNPGMAFGTGTHPSTQLCLAALEDAVRPGDCVVDLGTGSGILAIAAAKLGSGTVVAADIDRLALRVARQNLEDNGLLGKVLLVEADSPAAFTRVDVLVANILAHVIRAMAPSIPAALAPRGTFIGAGIAEGQEPEVIQSLTDAGLRVHRVMHQEAWVALVAFRDA